MNKKAIANLGCLFILALTLMACTKQNQQALQQPLAPARLHRVVFESFNILA